MKESTTKKSATATREEEVLDFWNKHNIFQKSLKQTTSKREFVFYDGPPFATGLPHYGSLLSSIVKDVIPRYKTMRGYHVRRRWGWDCHGLPIENMIEKELGIKTKKEIEEMGIAKFNEACRASVLRYADAWKEYVDRIGRWVEYENAYKTMDVTYMESVWWALKRLHTKKLLYEGRKVLLYCPHCETPLAKAEVAQDNSYKDVTEEAVTVKFKMKDAEMYGLPQRTYFLAWTTTPWTLPGNVALAVGADISYALVKQNGEGFILAESLVPTLFSDTTQIERTFTAEELEGVEYEPLFKISAVEQTGKRGWYVTTADFVTTEEGTGIVHTAVIYGEDDYQLGVEKDLPMVPLLDASGHFTDKAPQSLHELYFKKAEEKITEHLDRQKLIFDRKEHTHSYPHCHRCDTALLYNAISSWFIRIQKVKKLLIWLNKMVNWIPEHLKNGRFLNILKSAPDWTISRNRYWASPLPIWKCVDCKKLRVVGSVAELKRHTKKSGNSYFVMRHGGAESNKNGIASTKADADDSLTESGQHEVQAVAQRIQKDDIDLIVTSPFMRTKETADILKEQLKLKNEQVVTEKRLGEVQAGEFDGKPWSEYHAQFASFGDEYFNALEGAETRIEVRQRAMSVLYDLEAQYTDKKILLVTHGGVARELVMAAAGISVDETITQKERGRYYPENAEVREVPFTPMPHNEQFDLDLHRPYIDEIVLVCSCDGAMHRIPEVVDGWVESASMPFAEYHYPFENKRVFKRRRPGDFIAEYIGQTRTWFYYMHAVAGMLFWERSFKNVVTTGNILAADGNKMSKSKGNYTDPLINLNLYGADALRYYLMTSTVMQAEDVRFLDEELREAHNRVVNILWNVATFYTLYAGSKHSSTKREQQPSTHLLDRWIRARLNEVIVAVTESLDAYDTVRAGRPIREFIEDLSTWYVRRSRDRFKSGDRKDAHAAISTLRFVLLELSKITAPCMPFVAESVYRNVRYDDGPESVHLASWPMLSKMTRDDEKLIEDMQQVREVVSRGLEARARAGIKVRQPLASLTISVRLSREYMFLVRDEVNVKEVKIDTEMLERVHLDTDMTDELKQEGQLRDFVRHIQGLRKDEKLNPGDVVILVIATDEAGQKFVKDHEKEIRDATLLKDLVVDSNASGKEVSVGETNFTLEIRK